VVPRDVTIFRQVRQLGTARWGIGACLSALVLAAGCGGDESSEPTRTAPSETAARSGLAKPVLPRCAVPFGPPRTRPDPRKKGAWILNFEIERDPQRPPPPGATTAATVFESPPTGGRAELEDGRDLTIAGRRVSLVDRTERTSYAARWNTKTADYTAIADGSSPRAIGELVKCLP
jgi:hypothetical protein